MERQFPERRSSERERPVRATPEASGSGARTRKGPVLASPSDVSSITKVSTCAEREAEIRLSLIKKLLFKYVDDFYAGKLKDKIDEWIKLTSDVEILDMIRGLHIEFECLDHINPFSASTYNFSEHDEFILDKEVSKLLSKGVICIYV